MAAEKYNSILFNAEKMKNLNRIALKKVSSRSSLLERPNQPS
jgi:hypothetical protein